MWGENRNGSKSEAKERNQSSRLNVAAAAGEFTVNERDELSPRRSERNGRHAGDCEDVVKRGISVARRDKVRET